MLTYPSDSLPPIVCPMDEHAITPHSLCSAPPHSEPPTPLLPLPSITPSCVENGISGQRRSGRIQEIRAQTPRKQNDTESRAGHDQTPPHLQVSQSQQEENQDGFGICFASDVQNKDQKSPPDVSTEENVVEQFSVDSTQNLDSTKSDMDSCAGLTLGHSFGHESAPKGWVIGPLFQSFRSKMASFTEIVMSPVKLFRASSPPPTSDRPDDAYESELPDAGLSEPDHELQSDTRTVNYSKKLSFDEDCAISQDEETSPDPVPSPHRPTASSVPEETPEPTVRSTPPPPPPPFVDVSASQEPKAVRQKAPLRKCAVRAKKVSSRTSAPRGKKEESEVGDKADAVKSAQCDSFDGQKITGQATSDLLDMLSDSVEGTTPSLDIHQLDCQLNPQTEFSAAGPGRTKRIVEPDSRPQETVKRKRLTAAAGTKDTQRQKLINAASDAKILKPSRREAALTSPSEEETLKPARKRPAVTTRANKKAKGEEILNKTPFNSHAESPSDAMLVYTCSSVSENAPKGGSCKPKPRLKTRAGPNANTDSDTVDPETRTAFIKQAEQDLLRPAIKPLQSASKRRNINKKPQKRKSPVQPSAAESDGGVFSTPPSLELSDLTHSDPHKQETSGNSLNQSKRPRKGQRVAGKSTPQTKKCAKENQPTDAQILAEPVYFEMTPFEVNQQPVALPCRPVLEASGKVDGDVFTDGGEEAVAGFSVRARAVNTRPRRADSQRRRCRVLHGRARKGEEPMTSVTMDDADLAPAPGRSLSRRLLRSYSCPEIPSLRPHDVPWVSPLSPPHSRIQPPLQHPSSVHTPSLLRALRRARRHTVCSVEVEREIAPLCLRKEVYPSRRSLPCDRTSQHLSPSTSLSALASCFLSSPLAFLSKKPLSRGAAAASAGSSPSTFPLIFLERIDDANTSTLTYSSSVNPLECEMQRRRSEEDDDGEDTSSSSHEFEDVALREEKSLSDSEIKVVQKNEERGKVSSIRIRKTLPKPQNNLTPMGLPRPVRLKKKEFSLEEIYTNKNFSKPPESRLETIFEVPLNRRNGSESWFSQRRLKRFLEFLDAGEVRKPKKPLVGVGKAGGSTSRTRRGGFPKDEPTLSPQDVDSLLCAKLDQLSLWLSDDQRDS